ncbi:transporter associated domain-containing protein, partial [Flavihumibacter cheonanensis]|uniref:transporter associated domain-containing protein n=1 Tax=Flavihumibacter cheonanensis TaxID=1442385 RepID=UPI00293E12B3
TVAGLVMSALGHMPKRGETVDVDGFRFTVARCDNRRIYLLDVVPLTAEEGFGDEEHDVKPLV